MLEHTHKHRKEKREREGERDREKKRNRRESEFYHCNISNDLDATFDVSFNIYIHRVRIRNDSRYLHIYQLKVIFMHDNVFVSLYSMLLKQFYQGSIHYLDIVKSTVCSISLYLITLILFYSLLLSCTCRFSLHTYILLEVGLLSLSLPSFVCCNGEKYACVRVVFRHTKACRFGDNGNCFTTTNEYINRMRVERKKNEKENERERERERTRENKKMKNILQSYKLCVVNLSN